jgi:hypothetical protein
LEALRQRNHRRVLREVMRDVYLESKLSLSLGFAAATIRTDNLFAQKRG